MACNRALEGRESAMVAELLVPADAYRYRTESGKRFGLTACCNDVAAAQNRFVHHR